MKTRLLVLAILFFALYSNDSYSQYYGNRNNRSGVDRSIGNDAPRSNKKREKQDYAETAVAYLTKEIKLDGLQQAAVKTIINDNKGSLDEVMKMNISNEEKRDKMLAINDKIDKEITKLLSPEQIEKYQKMRDEREKKALTN